MEESSSWAGVFDECRGLRALPFGWNEQFWKDISYENQDHMQLRTGRWGWCTSSARRDARVWAAGTRRTEAHLRWLGMGAGGGRGQDRQVQISVIARRRRKAGRRRAGQDANLHTRRRIPSGGRGSSRGLPRSPASDMPGMQRACPNRCIFLHLAACYDARMMPARWNRPQCIFGETLRKRETRAGLSLRVAARRARRGRRGRCWRREKGRGSGGCRGQRRRVALTPSGGRTAGVRRAKRRPSAGKTLLGARPRLRSEQAFRIGQPDRTEISICLRIGQVLVPHPRRPFLSLPRLALSSSLPHTPRLLPALRIPSPQS